MWARGHEGWVDYLGRVLSLGAVRRMRFGSRRQRETDAVRIGPEGSFR